MRPLTPLFPAHSVITRVPSQQQITTSSEYERTSHCLLADVLFHSRLTRAVLSFCCGSSLLLTLGFYSGVIYLDYRWTELDLCSAKWMEKQNRKFRGTGGGGGGGGVIFLSVFLDVGLGLPSILVKLNLYFPAPLKVAGENVTHYG